MKNRIWSKAGIAVFLMVFGFALPQAYGDEMKNGNEMMKENETMKKEGAMAEKRGAVLAGSQNHHASGEVSIIQEPKGNFVLVLKDLDVDKVPDGRIYLAKDGDYAKGVELGKLKQFSGNVEFPIPANVNHHDYNSIVLWCKKFSVEIAHASFETGETGMTKGMK